MKLKFQVFDNNPAENYLGVRCDEVFKNKFAILTIRIELRTISNLSTFHVLPLKREGGSSRLCVCQRTILVVILLKPLRRR